MSIGTKTSPLLPLMAAFATAAAQAAVDPEQALRRQASHTQLQQQLREAQVELYCAHQAQATRMLQQARHQLLAAGAAADVQDLHTVDRSLWLLRRGQTQQAIAMLEEAHQRA